MEGLHFRDEGCTPRTRYMKTPPRVNKIAQIISAKSRWLNNCSPRMPKLPWGLQPRKYVETMALVHVDVRHMAAMPILFSQSMSYSRSWFFKLTPPGRCSPSTLLEIRQRFWDKRWFGFSFGATGAELAVYKWISSLMAFWTLCAACHEDSPETRLRFRAAVSFEIQKAPELISPRSCWWRSLDEVYSKIYNRGKERNYSTHEQDSSSLRSSSDSQHSQQWRQVDKVRPEIEPMLWVEWLKWQLLVYHQGIYSALILPPVTVRLLFSEIY